MVLTIVQCNGHLAFGQNAESYLNTRKKLLTIGGLKKENLKDLFQTGDENIENLINALNDENDEVRTNAQIAIRYLGNKKGMDALFEVYKKSGNKDFIFTGTVPLPIHDIDYKLINLLCPNNSKKTCELPNQYLFALSLDHSTRAKEIVHQLTKNMQENNIDGPLLKYIKPSVSNVIIPNDADLAKLVLENASFLGENERELSSVKFISYNAKKDKALLEIYINGGALAEEWYHIVVSKCDQGWKFFSISLVAVS